MDTRQQATPPPVSPQVPRPKRHRVLVRGWNATATSFRSGGAKVVRLVRRLDVLSATGPVSGKREAILLVVIPLLTFCTVLAVTSLYGVGYSPGCNSARNFVKNLFFLQ